MFDTPAKPQPHHQHNRLAQHPAVNGAVSSPQSQQPQPTIVASASPSLQNPRVAHLQFAAGPSISSTAFPNRFTSPTQNHFYASSAPSSTVALNHQVSVRPPVPPFPHSTGSIPQIPGKMVLEDLQGLSDYSAAGFEGASFSPAMAASYDLNSSVSSSSVSNLGTVSPNDLLLQDPFMSAPNSTALTALTSPSEFDDSPYGDSYDVSPNFGGNDFDAAGHDTWFPLFAQDTTAAAAGLAAGGVQASPAADQADDVEPQATPSRRKSGHNRSSSTSTKHSSTNGVNASRRREKPLPPIIVDDPNDIVAMKRARNTLAARKSRERKALRLDELEEEIAKLKAERDHWKKMALGHKA